ncbi:hypothetical protein AAULR_07686 [Lacticaseibacillus rhamnosus MTCC 5462]|nr:hypothetical protein AAULR_07686 [Lacticaseibacillus rhamnosus MTCC 5462]
MKTLRKYTKCVDNNVASGIIAKLALKEKNQSCLLRIFRNESLDVRKLASIFDSK